MSCELLFFTTTAFFFHLLRCDAATQRDGGLCDLYRACHGNDFAHFLIVYLLVAAR